MIDWDKNDRMGMKVESAIREKTICRNMVDTGSRNDVKGFGKELANNGFHLVEPVAKGFGWTVDILVELVGYLLHLAHRLASAPR